MSYKTVYKADCFSSSNPALDLFLVLVVHKIYSILKVKI